MATPQHAIQAYRSASRLRSQREVEADVFRQTIAGLELARDAGPVQRIKALADNRRLWLTIGDLMRDPGNALPDPLKASILSVTLTVHREMDRDDPDFDFLISINGHMAAGLSGHP